MMDSGNTPQSGRQNPARGRMRDVRLRALAFTAGPIIAGGIAIAYLPGWLHAPGAGGSQEAHAREKAEAEIRQRFQRGVAALNAKQYEQAISDFHRVLELAPEMPEAHVNSGFALIGMERYAVARDFFEGAIALRRNQVNAYYGLAVALEGLNDLPGALGAMRTYLHLAPADDPYRRKAQSAVWEWEARVAEEQARGKPAPAGKAGDKK
ncbi:MAG: tetratricopeptide repeat protein [Nitrosomonadales bacterium]|nr:tetratricopeptide repeat protein [Nitrosomonadales bacterium]